MRTRRPKPVFKIIILLLLIFLNLSFITIFLLSLNKALSKETNWSNVSIRLQTYSVLNTKSFVKRYLYSLQTIFNQKKPQTIKQALEKQKIPFYQVKIKPKYLSKLNQDLPASGKEYVPIKIKIGNKWKKAKLKYRGDSFYHWGFEKKSYLIRLKDDTKLNLINPKSANFIADDVAFKIAKNDFDLFVPKSDWVGLFINGNFVGIFSLVEEIDDNFVQGNHFNYALEGEKASFSNTTGYPLFIDSKKWQDKAGYPDNQSKTIFENFIKAMNNFDFTYLVQHIDFEYFARFYSFVSLIQNLHFDTAHNWQIGIKEGKVYPIVWDPVAWIMSYDKKKGNKVEEIISPVSQMLRKNIYFNQMFSETLWNYLTIDKATNIYQYIDEEKERSFPILDYDLFKGGSHLNPNGTRFPQSTKNILENMKKLKTTVEKRNSFLKKQLSQAQVTYWYQDSYLYIKYSGIAGSSLEDVDFLNKAKVEVFNNNKFISYPNLFEHKYPLLVAGRIIPDTPSLKLYAYAFTCPMTYRIFVGQNKPAKIFLKHSLTEKIIPAQPAEDKTVTDCQMNFQVPKKTNSTSSQFQKEDIQQTPLQINLETKKLSKYFNFNNQEKAKIQLLYNQFKTTGKLKKQAFSNLISIKLDEVFNHNNKYYLIQKNDQSDGFFKSQKIAQKYNFPVSTTFLFPLEINDFYADSHYLFEQPNKAFIEKNQLTFDTDIYRKVGFNTLQISNWTKISTDPRKNINDLSSLNEFLEIVSRGEDIEKYIDINNFQRLLAFMKESGNENLDYLLYFDNTQGKYLFLPYFYTYYKNNNFSIKDPLIRKIKNYFDKKGFDINNVVYPAKFNLGLFSELVKDNILVLPENTSYQIDENVIIPSNVKVIINKGVKIKIAKGKSVLIYGQLQAQGTKEAPIIITSEDKEPFGSFALIGEKASNSLLEYVYVKNGSEAFINNIYLSGMFSAYHVNKITIKNSRFENSRSDDGVNIKYSQIEIFNSVFKNNSADALDLDFTTGKIVNNFFENNGNDGIDISGSTVLINKNKINNSGDKCISVGEKSYPIINNNFLHACNIGIEAKDMSEVNASDNIFYKNKIAVNAYQKKDFFGGSKVNIINSYFYKNNKNATLINTFRGKKFKSDKSRINIRNSTFDSINSQNSSLISIIDPQINKNLDFLIQ